MNAATPRLVLVFSGHMMDAPDRAQPRFPPAMEPAAAARIAAALDEAAAGERDLALTQGASGGDLLFAEACLARRVPLRLLLPLPEPAFIAQSLLPSAHGEQWRRRYEAVRQQAALPPQGPPPLAPGANPFEACNQRLLDTAFGAGAQEVRLIVLWNGSGGDGPGGTAHMMELTQQRGGRVVWIDTRTL